MARKKTTTQKPSTKPVKKTKKVSSEKKINLSLKNIKMPDFKKIWNQLRSPKWEPVFKTIGLTLIILGSFIGIDFLVQYLNNDYSVAVVNGERISKSEYYKLLDSSYGESIVNTLIDNALIYQEAEKEGIELTDEEIDNELQATIEYVGGEETYESLLKANNITNDDVIKQIELSLLTTKLMTPTLEYTDDDVKKFFDEYSDVIFEDETAALEEGEELDFDDYKDQTEEVYISQLVSDNEEDWLSGLEEKAVIQNNVTAKPSYSILGTTRNIVMNLIDRINGTEEE